MISFINSPRSHTALKPPSGEDWIHEVKHDGYRTLLIIERGNARAYTRKEGMA
jgi:bifunctional non-homologous end joining protein LigD